MAIFQSYICYNLAMMTMENSQNYSQIPINQWVALSEHLQETIDFPMKIIGFFCILFP